jgi:hypothetical protein
MHISRRKDYDDYQKKKEKQKEKEREAIEAAKKAKEA